MKHIVLVFLLSILVCGCTSTTKNRDKQELTVSILPLKFFADQISCGDFDVNVLVPPGASPETYEPTPQQLKKLSDSKLYIQLGLLDFEQAMSKGLMSGIPSVEIVNLSESVDVMEGTCAHGHDDGHHHGIDPHIWLSPKIAKKMSKDIYDNLVKINPDSSEKYNKNLDVLIKSIDLIDSSNQANFSKLDNKVIVIYHPALSYFAKDYGLQQLSLEQDGKEPSAKHLKSIISTIKNNNIKTVFYQKQFSSTTVEAIVNECGIESQPFDPLEYDWLQNMRSISEKLLEAL